MLLKLLISIAFCVYDFSESLPLLFNLFREIMVLKSMVIALWQIDSLSMFSLKLSPFVVLQFILIVFRVPGRKNICWNSYVIAGNALLLS